MIFSLNNVVKNLFIFLFLIFFILYVLEIFLGYKLSHLKPLDRVEQNKKPNFEFDTRSQSEVIFELSKEEENIFQFTSPDMWQAKEGLYSNLQKSEKIFPLSGLSYGKSVFCNELGFWTTLPNDIYGFNNPSNIYNEKIDIVILGDSFARGACVDIKDSLAGLIRNNTNFNVSSLANGGGPLIELATLIEYGKKLKPRYLLWLFYEGNDHENIFFEKDVQVLNKYLTTDFDQNLINRQKEINNVVVDYINYESNKKRQVFYGPETNIKKNLFLKKLRQVETNIKNFLFLRKLRHVVRTAIFKKYYYKYEPDLFRNILEKAKNISDENNINFYFVYIPTFHRNAYDLPQDYLYRDEVLQAAEDLKINIIDFQNRLIKEKDILSHYALRRHNHFNEKGYRLLFDEINKNLKK